MFKDSHLYEGCSVRWNQYVSGQKLPSTDLLKQQNHTQSHELCFSVFSIQHVSFNSAYPVKLNIVSEAKIKGSTTTY